MVIDDSISKNPSAIFSICCNSSPNLAAAKTDLANSSDCAPNVAKVCPESLFILSNNCFSLSISPSWAFKAAAWPKNSFVKSSEVWLVAADKVAIWVAASTL